MPDLISRLIVELTDHVSGPAGKAAKSLKGIGDASKSTSFKQGIGEVNKLADALKKAEAEAKKLQNFKLAFSGFADAREKFRSAQAAVKALGDELAKAKALGKDFEGGQKALGKMQAHYSSAVRIVKNAAKDYKTQSNLIKGYVNELNITSFSGLERRQQNLKTVISRTNAEFQKQLSLASQAGRPGTTGSGKPVPPGNFRKETLQAVGGATAGWSVWQWLRDGVATGYDFQKERNRMRAQGGASPEQTAELARYAQQYSVSTGKVSPKGALEIMTELQKAGLSPGSSKEAFRSAVDLAAYGGVDPIEAAGYISSGAAIYRLPMDTPANVRKSSSRIADNVAFGAASTLANVDDIMTAHRYAGPVGNLLKLTPEKVTAMSMTLAQQGYKGAEIGTALRSLLIGAVKPTLDANQAMAEIGLNFSDFVTERREWTPEEAVSGMETRMGRMKKGAAGRLREKMDAVGGVAPGELDKFLTEFFIDETGSDKVQDKERVSKSVRRFTASQAETMDIDALLAAIQSKNLGPGYLARLVNAKHGSRLSSLLTTDDYSKNLDLVERFAPGSAARQSDISQEGFVGMWNSFANSIATTAIGISEGIFNIILGTGNLVRKFYDPQLQHERKKSQIVSDQERARETLNWMGLPSDWVGSKGNQSGTQRVSPGKGDKEMPAVKLDGAQETRSEAQSLSASLISLLGITVSPLINQDSITAAIGKVQQLRQELLSLNSSVSNVRGVHADTGPGGGTGW